MTLQPSNNKRSRSRRSAFGTLRFKNRLEQSDTRHFQPTRNSTTHGAYQRAVGRLFMFGFSEKVMFRGGEFLSLSILKRDYGWLAVVKCKYKDKPYVAFESSDTLYWLCWVLSQKKAAGGFKWKPD